MAERKSKTDDAPTSDPVADLTARLTSLEARVSALEDATTQRPPHGDRIVRKDFEDFRERVDRLFSHPNIAPLLGGMGGTNKPPEAV